MLTIYLSLIESEADRIKFEEIYYAYRKQMVLMALSLLHNVDDAEDVVHDVFMRIATKHMSVIQQIHNKEDIRNYLLKATKNTALNTIKKRERLNFSLDTVNEFDLAENISDNTFLDLIFQKIEYEQIVSVLIALEEPYRDILYYHFVLELPVPEAARQLGRNIATAKKQLVRGKKLLLERLGIKGESHATK